MQIKTGHVISWRVPSKVQLSELRDALRAVNISESLIGDLAPYHGLARALRQMCNKGHLLRRLERSGDEISFQFTSEFLAANGIELEYLRVATVTIHMPTGRVTADDPNVQAAAVKLMQEELERRRTGDLTKLVQRIIDIHGRDLIPIRDQGGAYFVPQAEQVLIDQLSGLLNQINGNIRCFAITLGDQHTDQAVASSVFEYVEGMIRDFERSLEDVWSGSRVDKRENRINASQEIRQRLDLYRGVLGGLASQIEESIQEADVKLLEALQRQDEPGKGEAGGATNEELLEAMA